MPALSGFMLPFEKESLLANLFGSTFHEMRMERWLTPFISTRLDNCNLAFRSSQTKVTRNILHCLRYGSEVGWLIDPKAQTVFIYRSKQEPEVLDEPEQIIPVPSFARELQLTIQELFDWLLE